MQISQSNEYCVEYYMSGSVAFVTTATAAAVANEKVATVK